MREQQVLAGSQLPTVDHQEINMLIAVCTGCVREVVISSEDRWLMRDLMTKTV